MSPQAPPPAATMMKIVTAYWLSQAVGVVATLGIADLLSGGPRDAKDLARETKTNPDALHRVLRCCASVGIFSMHSDRRFGLTALGETLCSGSAGSLRDFAIAETAPGHWLPWGKLESAVKTGSPATHDVLGSDIFGFYATHPDEAGPFTRAMGNLSAMVSGEVVRVADLRKAEIIVDVGGANGTLLAAALAANPRARGVVFDLPHVVADAKAYLSSRGLQERTEVLGGDFFANVPPGDALLLKQVLHDWDDAKALSILRRCRDALRSGGRLVVVEMLLPEDNAPSMAQLMDLNMLVMLTGRERSKAEFEALLSEAGLRLEHVHSTHSPFFVLEAVAA
jgi:SAM-dependent methyltransferase